MGQGLYDKLISELEAISPVSGLLMTDILDLPDSLRQVVQWILRKKYVESIDLADHLGIGTKGAWVILELLTKKGFLEEANETGVQRFRIRTSTVTHTTERRKPPPDLWDPIGEEPQK